MAIEEGYIKTDENIILNGRNYSIYINKDHDRCIEINDLLYPELSELQEKFHRVYKPILQKLVSPRIMWPIFWMITGATIASLVGSACPSESKSGNTEDKRLEKIIEQQNP